jgi:hypothetical protein
VEGNSKLIIRDELRCFQNAIQQKMLQSISFETLFEYLDLLQLAACKLSVFGPRVCFFLASAVSDFYIPKDEVIFILLYFYLDLFIFFIFCFLLIIRFD